MEVQLSPVFSSTGPITTASRNRNHTFGGAAPASSGIGTRSSQQLFLDRVTPTSQTELTRDEQRELKELQRRDREVRAHERAHKQAAGPHARGGPVYRYERGPDGRNYAVSGEVSIDTSEVPGNPQATIAKMQQVRRAALAPASPSAQDRQVAAEASRREQEARAELAKSQREQREESFGTRGPSSSVSRYDLFGEPGSELDVRV